MLRHEILVRVQKNRNSVLVRHPHYLPQCFQIGIVIHAARWLETLPGAVQPNGVHPPMLQVVEIVISQGVVAVEIGEVGVEGEDLVYCVDAVIYAVPAVLVEEERVGRVDLEI